MLFKTANLIPILYPACCTEAVLTYDVILLF